MHFTSLRADKIVGFCKFH